MPRKSYDWEQFTDEELLNLRFCDLKLRIEGSRVEPLIKKLYSELNRKALKFKPHIWVAKEWFSPDGVPGFAIPFFVLHDRLAKLERKILMDAEGYNLSHCMKLLRHETAHAMDNAYHLRRSRERQKLFGLSSTPYPESYAPRAYSKKFVVHLDSWYAQSHPDEDWAETFAVWLNPKSNWRKRYKHWAARHKLQFVHDTMTGLKGKRPKIINKSTPENLMTNRTKLKTYYNQRKDNLGLEHPYYLDPVLIKLFTEAHSRKSQKKASRFIRDERREISKLVARWTGQYQYTINLILQEIIDSCKEKKLYLKNTEKETRMDLVGMLTAHTLNYITKGNHRIPM